MMHGHVSAGRLWAGVLGLLSVLVVHGAWGEDVARVQIDAVAGLEFTPARFVVEPGQRVELTLTNNDQMPHNLVLTAPGARERVAELALQMEDGAANAYVPETELVLMATGVLNAGESETIRFQAPDEEGAVPFVCTYPGHAAVMYGVMHVTSEPDELPHVADDENLPGQVREAAREQEAPPEQWEDVELETVVLPVDLARGRAAEASSAAEGHGPGYAVNNHLGTSWRAAEDDEQPWWQVDLGAERTVRDVEVTGEGDARVEVSADGQAWAALDELAEARYVRISGARALSGVAVHGDAEAEQVVRERPHLVDEQVESLAEGFEAGLFAEHPHINYPVAVAPAGEGVLYVATSPNSAQGHVAGRGRVIRASDRSGDGVADHFQTVAQFDEPRGLLWDGEQLFVLHPPQLSVLRDTTGDGDYDEREVLVENFSYGLEHPRGTDHTANGMRLGIDGWIYVAVGDFGFRNARTVDGQEHMMRGGGLVRLRPDGTELEVLATGLRNNFDVGISPTLDFFTRDNSDAIAWDVRLHHVLPHAYYGYPLHHENFTDEMLEPLSQYGMAGSPTGTLWLEEPGWGADYNDRLLTNDWNLDELYVRELEVDGASFVEASQQRLLEMPNPTALQVDARGTLYVGSWYNGGFNYSGEDVGFVATVRPAGHEPEGAVDFDRMDDAELVEQIGTASQTRRLMAQQEMLRRGSNARFVTRLVELIGDEQGELGQRVAALFTLVQLEGAGTHRLLEQLAAEDAELREFALRALADRSGELDEVSEQPFVDALDAEDARVRMQAVSGLIRLGRPELAGHLKAMVGDADPAIAHVAERGLIELGAADVAFELLDEAGEPMEAGRRVLQALHRDEVVDGLLARLGSGGTPELERAVLVALARLHWKEDPFWSGAQTWWTVQPDLPGPYHRPVRWERTDEIYAALAEAYEQAEPERQQWLERELRRHQVLVPGETAPLEVLMITGGGDGEKNYDTQRHVIAQGLEERVNVRFTTDFEAGHFDSSGRIQRHEDTAWAEEFDVVLYNMCFTQMSDAQWVERIVQAHVEHGVPAVMIHCAVHSYSLQSDTDVWWRFAGVRSASHEAPEAVTVEAVAEDHPVLRYFESPWTTPAPEVLFEIEQMYDTATPLAEVDGQTGRHVVAWVNEHEQVRVFGTTIGHHQFTTRQDSFLNLVGSGLLWAVEQLEEDGEPAEGYGREGFGAGVE